MLKDYIGDIHLFHWYNIDVITRLRYIHAFENVIGIKSLDLQILLV